MMFFFFIFLFILWISECVWFFFHSAPSTIQDDYTDVGNLDGIDLSKIYLNLDYHSGREGEGM